MRARNFGLCFAASTVAGLFFFSQSLTRSLILRDPEPWWDTLTRYLVGLYLIALLVPLVLWPSRRLPIERRVWLPRVALHLLFSVIFSLLELAIAYTVGSWLGLAPGPPGTPWHTYRSVLIWDFHAGITFYWVLLGGEHALRYYRKYRQGEQEALRLALRATELQRQLARAQLHALKAQLHPHFLFNTLNAIMVLVRHRRSEQAEQTLALLSELLRRVLEDCEAQEVSLRRELEFLRLYLAIERVRVGDRLQVETDIAPETLDAAVPHLGLQPIVENAIRHGIGQSSAAGRITIRSRRQADRLQIEVRDDGPGLRASRSGGMGLSNTRARLTQLYGSSGRLTVENAGAGGVVAALSIPFHSGVDGCELEMGEADAVHSAAG